MTSVQVQKLKQMQVRLHHALLNGLTYPQTLLDYAQVRMLTAEEIRKARECLQSGPQRVEAELTLFILSLAEDAPQN